MNACPRSCKVISWFLYRPKWQIMQTLCIMPQGLKLYHWSSLSTVFLFVGCDSNIEIGIYVFCTEHRDGDKDVTSLTVNIRRYTQKCQIWRNLHLRGDNVDHNIRTLGGTETYYGMGIVAKPTVNHCSICSINRYTSVALIWTI